MGFGAQWAPPSPEHHISHALPLCAHLRLGAASFVVPMLCFLPARHPVPLQSLDMRAPLGWLHSFASPPAAGAQERIVRVTARTGAQPFRQWRCRWCLILLSESLPTRTPLLAWSCRWGSMLCRPCQPSPAPFPLTWPRPLTNETGQERGGRTHSLMVRKDPNRRSRFLRVVLLVAVRLVNWCCWSSRAASPRPAATWSDGWR